MAHDDTYAAMPMASTALLRDRDGGEQSGDAETAVPPRLKLPPLRSAETLVAAQQAALRRAIAHEPPVYATDNDGHALSAVIGPRAEAAGAARVGALMRAGASPEAMRKAVVEMAQDAHRDERAAFEAALRCHASAEAQAEAGRWSTARGLAERTERLLEGLSSTSTVIQYRLALEQRGQALTRAWQLLAVDQRLAEARGRATRMYRHNVRRADGQIDALRGTEHYWVEMRDGRRVGMLRRTKAGCYRFTPATRMDRRLTAALRERFGSERFYEPDDDAIAIAKLAHDFEAQQRAAGARETRALFERQEADQSALTRRPIELAGKTPHASLALTALDAEEWPVGSTTDGCL
jgi:hypothetical protein